MSDGIGPHILRGSQNQEPGLFLALQYRISLSDASGIMPGSSHSPHPSPFTSASSPKIFSCVTGACAFVVHSQYNLWSKLPDALLIGAFSHYVGSSICLPSDTHFILGRLFRHTHWLTLNEWTFEYTLDRA